MLSTGTVVGLNAVELSNHGQFWWNWWVNIAVAVGTFCAVLVALFGDWIKSLWFRPKLALKLRNPKGERTKVMLFWTEADGKQGSREAVGRYYHVQVSSLNRWPPATNVQVFLTRIEEPGPDGELQIKWSGDIPIRWRNQEIFPPTRTIGPATDCDLCGVVENKWLDIYPLVKPNNLESQRRGAVIMVVSLQARSNEADSRIHRFKISWDGKWEDGDAEMSQHLVLKDITQG